MRKSGLKKRAKPGSVALREVKRYQRSVNLVIPRAPFARVVREITSRFNDCLNYQANAIKAL